MERTGRIGALVLVMGVLLAAPRAPTDAQVLNVGETAGTRYRLSCAEGELQLHRLARSSKVEEAWLLASDTWTVIGYHEQRSSVSVDLSVTGLVLGSADPGAAVAFYHLHPFHEDPRFIEPPSLQDVHSLALMKKLSAAIKGVIFDGRGKWTFDVTDGRRDELLAAEGGSESYAGAHGYGSRRDPGFLFDRRYPLIAWNENSSPAGREEKIRRFIVSARNLGVTVTYAPIEP